MAIRALRRSTPQDSLELASLKPLANGSKSLLYLHPHHPDRLIKVRHPYLTNRLTWPHPRIFAAFRAGWRANREAREQRRLEAKGKAAFLPRYYGKVQTDLGIGHAFEAILDDRGNLAPTLLAAVRENGITDEIEVALVDLAREILESEAVIGDLNLKNVVYGRGRLYVVDGLTSKTLIPLIEWSRWHNRRSLLRRIGRLHERLRVAAKRSVPHTVLVLLAGPEIAQESLGPMPASLARMSAVLLAALV